MARPIAVFICYKKTLSYEKDGRSSERPNEKAGILHLILSEAEAPYDSWMDEAEIAGGMSWETEIYRKILVSDVMLALVGPGTSGSDWVKREIALATALGISIVPIGFDLTRSQMDEELKALDIAHLQGKITQNIKPTPKSAREGLLNEVRVDLQRASERTQQQQQETLRGLLARRTQAKPKAPDKQRAASFVLKHGDQSVALHVASGDLAKVRDIDILVNSENDYMQMARFFESRTVSSILRRRGARIREGKYEDTIQRELDWQLRDRARPVQAGEVFATSAGGPNSDLARTNKARYIFHVAAVQAVDAESRVVPYQRSDQIEDCVRGSLGKMSELNQQMGVISPPDTEQRKEQERLAGLDRGICRSIVFPVFGTGQGGSACRDVVRPMLSGIRGFLEDPDQVELANVLKDIYISVFSEQDVDEVIASLRAELTAKTD